MRLERLRRSLPAKLLVAQLLVIAAGSLTLLVVALSIGPAIFRRHVRDALGVVPGGVSRHLDMAYSQATLISLSIAIAAAVLTAIGVSWFVSMRVARPIRVLSEAAQRVARGEHDTRVPVGDPDVIGVLADAFNQMAGALDTAEQRRRELLSDVAHELRTPLATLQGYLEGIADGVLTADAETLKALHDETHRMARLVEDLAKVSRAEERQLDLHLGPVEPGTLLETAVTSAGPAYAAKGVSLYIGTTDHLPPIWVDADRIGEVLANLLENALRHTPVEGRVELSAARDGREVMLSVVDTGEGIDPEHLERVFERFYRVDRARSRGVGGSGIGLAIARAIVEAHGGQLRAESPGVGHGARFVIVLPIETADAHLAYQPLRKDKP